MLTKRQSVWLIALAIGLMLIVGCSPGSSAPPPTPGQASVPFPTGMFVANNGATAAFDPNGTVAFRTGTEMNDDENYKVTGDQISFLGGRCTAYGGDGLYQWSFDGKTLSLKALNEPCAARGLSLRNVDWIKK